MCKCSIKYESLGVKRFNPYGFLIRVIELCAAPKGMAFELFKFLKMGL